MAKLSFELWHLWPVSMLVGVLAVWLCVRMYWIPAEGGRRLRWLPGLRCGALLLVAVSLLGPVWKRPATGAEKGEIAVLLDTSRSMGVVDVQRSGAERLRIAVGLGMYRDVGASRELGQLEAVRVVEEAVGAVVAARASVDFVELTRSDPREAREKLRVAREALMRAVGEASGGGGGMPEGAKGALSKLEGLDDAGSAGWQKRAMGFLGVAREQIGEEGSARMIRLVAEDAEASRVAAAVSGMSRLRLAQAMVGAGEQIFPSGVPVGCYTVGEDGVVRALRGEGGEGEAGGVGSLVAEGGSGGRGGMGGASDLSGAIARLAAPEGDRRVRAVVLMSDGRGVAGGSERGGGTGGEVSNLAPGVKVYAVAMAPEAVPPGVRVVGVEVPTAMIAGQTARVRLVLRAVGASAVGRAEVRMILPGQTQSRQVNLSGEEDAVAEFDLVADRAGDIPLELMVPVRGGDAPGTGIRLRRIVRVTAERARVLLVSSFPSWDVQQLRNELARTPWVRLMEVTPTEELAGQIGRADAVVMGDVAAGQLNAGARAALRDLVDRRAGGLMLLPGPSRLPGTWEKDEELARYLPGKGAKWVTSPSGVGSFVVSLASGEQGGMGSEQDWGGRNGFWRLVRFGEMSAGVRVLLEDRGSGLAVLVEKPVGLGRSLMLMTDQAWRWGRGDEAGVEGLAGDGGWGGSGGGTPWRMMLGRLVERPYPATEGSLSLDAAVRMRRGGTGEVDVRARRVSADGAPARMQADRVVLRESGRTVHSGELVETSAGRYGAVLGPVGAGEYTLQVEGAEEPRLIVRVGDGGEGELADPSGDRGTLERLARATGGVSVGAEDVAKLGPLLSGGEGEAGKGDAGAIRTVRLWNSPGLMVLIVSLLSAEWALRKHWGLA